MSSTDVSNAAAKLLSLRNKIIKIREVNLTVSKLGRLILRAMAIGAVVLLALIIYDILGLLYMPPGFMDNVVNAVTVIMLPIALVAYIYAKSEVKVTGLYVDWDEKVKEGVSGILNILESMDWEGVEAEISRAKFNYALIALARVTLLSMLLSIVCSYAIMFPAAVIGILPASPPLLEHIGVALSSILLAIAVEWNDLAHDARAIREADSLLWDIRWLYHELKSLQA